MSRGCCVMHSRRRLPSLHSIGRSRCVDLEELPTGPAWQSEDDDDDLSTSPSSRFLANNRPIPGQSKFDAFRALSVGDEVKNTPTASNIERRIEFPVTNEDSNVTADDDSYEPEVTVDDDITGSVFDQAESVSQTLRSHFHVALSSYGSPYLCPRLVAKPGAYSGDASESRFRHVTHSAQLALGLRDIDRLLAIRARLNVIRQVALQVRGAATFVSELRQLFDDECRTWYGVVRNDTDGRPPSTCLEQLHLLVDELRVHLGRWSAVRRHLMDYRRLCRRLVGQRCQPPSSSADSMAAMEDSVWQRLFQLGEAAFVFTERIVTVGFRNLAHCDLERIGQDTLWNVARGLEQFNSLFSSTDWCRHRFHSTSSRSSSWSMRRRLPIGPVSMTTVLELIANERSKYAAASIREHFVDNEEFLHLLTRCRVPAPSWQRLLERDNASTSTRIFVQMSDSTSGEPHSTAVNGTETKCDTDDHIGVPDLVGLPSPLIDFNRRESTFAARFIEVICRSTRLIQFAVSDQIDPDQSDQTPSVADDSSVDLNASSDGERQSPFANGSRKTVSWGDASLAVAAKHTMKYYVHAIWCRFAEHVFDFLITPEWLVSRVRRGKDRFDGVLLCPNAVALVLQSMIQRCSSDDKYPVHSRRAMYEVSIRLHSLVAWSASDAAFSGALSCCSSSLGARTLTAVALDGGRYATPSGRLLRDAILPLHAIVQQTSNCIAVTETQSARCTAAELGTATSADNNAVMSILYHSIHRLLAICNTSTAWYHQKTLHLSSSRAVESYLLISLEDLQILTEEYRNILSTCSPVMSSSSNACINNVWYSLNQSVKRLQALTSGFRKQFYQMFSAAAGDFFLQEMPTGKDWRRKNGDVCPVQNSDYIERAMEYLIQPVITATIRFKPETQLLALSTAISGLCEAWTTSILSQKIRFSYLGACQLEFDVLYTRTWLDSYVTDVLVRTAVTSHEALSYMDDITSLLKLQPPGSGGSKTTVEQQKHKLTKNNNDPSRDLEVNSKLAADRYKIMNSVTGEAKINTDDDFIEIPWKQTPYRDQWLALRVHGGTRTWSRLTSCFNNADT